MKPLESYTQSFVIKVWLEERTAVDGTLAWRGHITHVPGGEKRFVSGLDDIVAFIAPFLAFGSDEEDEQTAV